MAKTPEKFEYKLYLTSCSAIMKYWDEKAGKTTGQWIKNTRKMFSEKEKYCTSDEFYTIEAYLDLALSEHRNKDNAIMTQNYCNQMSKMHTYKLILASTQSDRQKHIAEIEKNLKKLESVAPQALGWHFIKRDFYYAMYEVLRVNKDIYFEKAWKENESLGGRGDAKAFGEMLSVKKQSKEKKDKKIKQALSHNSSSKEEKK